MSNTPRLGLPLVQPAQAQKHVTVNEALVLADGVCQMRLESVSLATPPVTPLEGEAYFVAAGGVNEWSGRDGEIAIRSNNGWVFATPVRGWRAWIADLDARAVFDGTSWRAGYLALGPGGAATRAEIVEVDHVIGAGTTSTVSAAIPADAMVLGVTGRLLTAVTGTLTSFRVGVAGADNRYGSGIGLAAGSWLRGMTSAPVTYYAATDLILTGEGGDFAGGDIRLAVHLMNLDVPD